ncbi:hypothetical protein [Salinibacter altiplanensis]|uniref:hypothetical protein n=1 Tax=Salinibacter altiplanensis TaxID=1803181 RepID=UPI000C9F35AB|nr:hypothetical protein [Salinibacter altiplanensis]
MPPSRSQKDWNALLAPVLSTSVKAASERLMQTEEIRQWLRQASAEAAEGMRQRPDMRGEMQGYAQLKAAFDERFPALLNAVADLTEGCGTIGLDWMPMNPTMSRVEVDFHRELAVDLFTRLDAPTLEAARAALCTVEEALPDGTPFPNRPNTATGLVAHDGSCVGVRVREHLGDDPGSRHRTVTLLPEDQNALENLSAQDAVPRLLQLLAPADSSAAA